MANHVFGNSCFRDIDAQFQKLSVYSRRTPKWICQAHFPNQLPGFPVNTRPPAFSAFPSPVVAKSLTMPADYCSRLHNVQDIRPAGPEATQDHPEQAVRICQVRPGTAKFQRCQLLPQSQIFKCQLTVPTSTLSKCSKDNFKPFAHKFTPA